VRGHCDVVGGCGWKCGADGGRSYGGAFGMGIGISGRGLP
jgi:hypothetical protein